MRVTNDVGGQGSESWGYLLVCVRGTWREKAHTGREATGGSEELTFLLAVGSCICKG